MKLTGQVFGLIAGVCAVLRAEPVVVDGGEIYQLRTVQEFAESYRWQKYGLSSDTTNSIFIPPALRPVWRNRLSVSWGVYDRAWWGAAMDAAIYRTTLQNALSKADHMVWAYPEGRNVLTPGGATQEWIDALRLAKSGAGAGSAKLIVHQFFGGATYPQWVHDNLTYLETQRSFVDGITIYLPNATGKVMTNTPLAYSSVVADLAPVKDLNSATLTWNLALVFNDRPADFFDDWSGCIRNWATMARAVRDAGLKGIAFDNENYAGAWSNYPDHCAYKDKTLKEYSDQARLRGRQVMEAMLAEFPDLFLLGAFHGPYISEPKTPTWIIGSWPQYYELYGPFFAGFLEALPASSATAARAMDPRGARAGARDHVLTVSGAALRQSGDLEVTFSLAHSAGPVSLALYDLRGTVVEQLSRGAMPAGAHTLTLHTTAAQQSCLLRVHAGNDETHVRPVLAR